MESYTRIYYVLHKGKQVCCCSTVTMQDVIVLQTYSLSAARQERDMGWAAREIMVSSLLE